MLNLLLRVQILLVVPLKRVCELIYKTIRRALTIVYRLLVKRLFKIILLALFKFIPFVEKTCYFKHKHEDKISHEFKITNL